MDTGVPKYLAYDVIYVCIACSETLEQIGNNAYLYA